MAPRWPRRKLLRGERHIPTRGVHKLLLMQPTGKDGARVLLWILHVASCGPWDVRRRLNIASHLLLGQRQLRRTRLLALKASRESSRAREVGIGALMRIR